MRSIIIGKGEIGKALEVILECPAFERHETKIIDIDILHIAFGYDENFEQEVKRYQNIYIPKYIIIHSTVPVGVSSKLNAIHSPIIGQHPNLEEGIRTFTKMLGGKQASKVADYFRRKGLKVVLFDKQETTEAAKLFLTEYYRVCIEFTKRVKNYSDKHNLSFSEIYTIPNIIYNENYKKLGYPEFVRPILQPIMTEEIGGHCVKPNSELIKLSENED